MFLDVVVILDIYLYMLLKSKVAYGLAVAVALTGNIVHLGEPGVGHDSRALLQCLLSIDVVDSSLVKHEAGEARKVNLELLEWVRIIREQNA